MKKGGYKIIDFKGTALSGTAVDMPGIYDQIVDDYDKPIMVSGVIISGELQDDAYASVKVSDGSVDLTVYDGVITVTDDDEVSFAAAKSPTELAAEIGDLDDLETVDKDSLVDAINEVNGKTLLALKKVSESTLSTDINDAVNGWAYYGSTAANRPSTGANYVLTLVHTSDLKCQLAINRATGNLYTRTYTENAWSSWLQATNVATGN